MSKLLLYFYVPTGDGGMIDFRIVGDGPLTARHLKTVLEYLDVMRRALAPEPASTDAIQNTDVTSPGGRGEGAHG